MKNLKNIADIGQRIKEIRKGQHVSQMTLAGLAGTGARYISELERGKEKADANRKVYAEMHDAVMDVLKSASLPVSAQEIADETGLARGKIVYGLTNYWADEVEKIPGKTNTYKVKGE